MLRTNGTPFARFRVPLHLSLQQNCLAGVWYIVEFVGLCVKMNSELYLPYSQVVGAPWPYKAREPLPPGSVLEQWVAVCVGVEHCMQCVGACTVCVTKACSVCGSVRFVGCQKLVVCVWGGGGGGGFEACRCICMYAYIEQ